MNYYDMKSEFLNVSKYSRYASELNNFERALSAIGRTGITTALLEDLRTSDIINTLSSLIEFDQYKSKSIALKYMTVMAQFFRFCMRNSYFHNESFLREINAPPEDKVYSYFYKVSQFIKKSAELKAVSKKSPLNQDEVDSVIEFIDGEFENIHDRSIQLPFEKYGALLGTKLMLFTGVKIGALYSIELGAVVPSLNTITVNNFVIRMPLGFTNQMQDYLDIRPDFSSKCLFVQNDGAPWKDLSTSKINTVLKTVIFRSDTSGFTKYGIRQLILAGTEMQTLEKLTQARATIIRGCATEEELFGSDQTRNIYLARQMAKTDIYHLC